MEVLPDKSIRIVKIGNEALIKKSDPITEFDENLANLADDMYETMLDNDGIGLAAPQIGVNIRFFVVDTQEKDGIGRLNLCNPKITYKSDDQVSMTEGCLSVPGVYLPVTRPVTIKVEFQKLNGKTITMTATGLLARVIQHEMDHLDGEIFLDLVTDKQALESEQKNITQIREEETAYVNRFATT